MLSKAEREKYILEIETLPQEADALVRELGNSVLDTVYRKDGWTPRQVIHHLADSHMNGYARMKLAYTENKPILKSYKQEQWAALEDVRLPVEPSLTILRGLHKRWGAWLRSVPEDAWARTGNHTEHGEMSLDDLLLDYAQHGKNHLQQIRGLKPK
jgi:hypothetical protein